MSILGDNSQGAATSPGNSDRALVTRFTAPDSGSNGTMYAYFGSGTIAGASAKGIVYTNSAGAPGTLVANTSGVSIPAAGGLVNLGTVTATWTASTDYFVGIVYSDYQAEIQADGSLSGIDTEMANGTLSYTTPPGTWPGTDITYDNIRVNVWVDYAAGGGSAISVIGSGALTATGAAAASGHLSAQAAGTLAGTGAARTASAASLVASAALAATGSARADSPVSIAAVASASFVGASTTLTAGDFSIASTATLSAAGASVNAAELNAAATALLSPIGAAVNAADISINSIAALTTIGAAVHSVLWSGTTSAVAAFVGDSVALGSAAFSISSAASMDMIGAASAEVIFSVALTAAATFVSAAEAAIEEEPARDYSGASGAYGRNEKIRKKRQKATIERENDEFIQMCQAALPILVAACINPATITYNK